MFFSAAKLFFAYGLGNGMTFPLWVGGTAVLLDSRPTPETTFATIERFRPTLFFGVPTLYAAQLACAGDRDARPRRRSGCACRPARRCRPTSCGAGASAPA